MKSKNTSGITLLLAVFISSLALLLGFGIFTLLFGELVFSGSAQESLTAFYAADAGIECALYWDTKQNAFATTSTQLITCNNNSFTVGGSSGVSMFTIPFDNGSCGKVEVTKGAETVIVVFGENTCAGPSTRVVQRGLRVNY